MPRLLRDWAHAHTTGTLTVTATPPSEDVCTLLLESGNVVFATRRSRRDPTGELFLELFEVAPVEARDAAELDRVRSRIAGVVADLFDWTSAEVTFRPEIGLTRWPALDLTMPALMRAGMLAVTRLERLRAWAGDPFKRLVRTDDPFGMFTLDFDDAEAAVLASLDAPRRLDEIVDASGVDEERVLRLVAALVFAGAVEHAAAEDVPAYDPHEAARFWYEVEEKLGALRAGVDYYALLGVDRRADTDAIIARYRDLATTFQPDRFAGFAPRDASGHTQLDVVFDALTTAFAVLTRPAFREQYDRELARSDRELGVRVAVRAVMREPSRARATPKPVVAATAAPEPAPLEPAKDTAPLAPPADAQPLAAPVATGSLSAVDWFRRGEQFAAVGDHSRAMLAFERADRLAPGKAKVLLALGRSCAHVAGHNHRAEEVLLQTIQLAPFAVAAYVELAGLYTRFGRPDDARKQLERALSIRPNDAAAASALADLDRAGSGLLKRLFGGQS